MQAAGGWWVVPEEAAFLLQLGLAELYFNERQISGAVEL